MQCFVSFLDFRHGERERILALFHSSTRRRSADHKSALQSATVPFAADVLAARDRREEMIFRLLCVCDVGD